MPPTQLRQLGDEIQGRLSSAAPYSNGLVYTPGRKARAILHASGNVVAGETVTIGSNVFIATVVNTDSTRNVATAMNATDGASELDCDGALLLADAGDLVRVENEIMKVIGPGSTTSKRWVARARCGTAIATHAPGVDVFTAAAPHATQIPFGVVAVLTPAVWVPSLAAEINNALAGGNRCTAKASTIFDPGTSGSEFRDAITRTNKVIAASGPATLDALLLQSALPEACVLAVTETLTNGNWASGATMVNGAVPALLREVIYQVVPTAAEDTHDRLLFPVPFTPRLIQVDVTVTASGLAKGWNGAKKFANGVVEIDNAGATDWAVTDTVTVRITE